MNRRNPKRAPEPGMVWSRKWKMWLDVDDRSPARRRADEAIARRADRERRRFVSRIKKDATRQEELRAKSAQRIARRVLESLIAARRKAGLTQSTVARRMGVPQPVVSRLELGSHSPTLTTLARYADAIGVRLEVWGVV